MFRWLDNCLYTEQSLTRREQAKEQAECWFPACGVSQYKKQSKLLVTSENMQMRTATLTFHIMPGAIAADLVQDILPQDHWFDAFMYCL